MVRAVVIIILVVCVFSANSMPGKRVRRGFNISGYGSDRRSGSGGEYTRGSDEHDASDSREDGGECGTRNFHNREAYGREDYNSNEGRHHGYRSQ